VAHLHGGRASYGYVRRRGAFDFPVLGVAAWIQFDEGKAGGGEMPAVPIKSARIILGGIAPSPIEVKEAGDTLIGHAFDDEHIHAAAEAAYTKARPLDNTDFVMNWRKQMTRQYTLRALKDLSNPD
jgi:4-hydroxybenzoyl-CoA reductase subunit beta